MAILSDINVIAGEAKAYLYGAAALVIAILVTLHIVDLSRLHAAEANYAKVETQLSVSNASISDLQMRLNRSATIIKANAEADAARQAQTKTALQGLTHTDKAKIALEATLINRPINPGCKTPKDLSDAWKTLSNSK